MKLRQELAEIRQEMENKLESLKDVTYVRLEEKETQPDWDINNPQEWDKANDQVIRMCSLVEDLFELIEKKDKEIKELFGVVFKDLDFLELGKSKHNKYYYDLILNNLIGIKENAIKLTDFSDDGEKMTDFKHMSKSDFLDSYNYLTEEEYNLTAIKIYGSTGFRVWDKDLQKYAFNSDNEPFKTYEEMKNQMLSFFEGDHDQEEMQDIKKDFDGYLGIACFEIEEIKT